MLFDAISFGYAYGLVILSFCLGLVVSAITNMLGIGGKHGF